jgi:endo-1,4-beta-xylanase
MRKGASGEGQDANPWYVALGSDFVYEAFLAARKADPDVKLYYNDYNMDMQNKAQLVHNMVRDINNRYKTEHPEANGRLLIEGIGMQAHYNTGTSVVNVRRSLELFKSLGVEMAISELDILAQTWNEYSANAGGPNPAGFMTQAKLYGELFSLFKEYSGTIKRVTLWGIADVQSWRERGKPLLFDNNFRAKPAYYRMMEAAD